MDGSAIAPMTKRIAPYVLAVVVGGTGVGYAVHEHQNARTEARQAQTLANQNAQMATQLNATNSQMNVLAAKVDDLAATSAAEASAASSANHRAAARAAKAQEMRLGKIQSQIDAENQQIAKEQSDLQNTQNDLGNTRTELTGSIARTHDELVVLEKRGQRNYYEFDLQKAKDFKREGPMSVSLRKANVKRGYADLMLIVDDRNLTQKHVNLYQPVVFYQPGLEQPVEVVINSITKDHIHGYISAPKYQPSELAAMAGGNANGATGQAQTDAQRKKLTITPSDTDDSEPVSSQPAATQQPQQQ